MKSIHYLVTLLTIVLLWSGCKKETALERARQWDVTGITPVKYTAKISAFDSAEYEVYVLEEGDGNHPLHQQTACFNMSIFLESGKAIYTRIDDGPLCERVGESSMPFHGLTDGILKMSHGAKYRFVFPYKLGYGDDHAYTGMASVPPLSTIYVDVEMTSKH